MKKYLLVTAIASGLVMLSGVSTVSADQNLQKLSITQMDEINAAGYKRRHYRKPSADAKAYASADAYGKKTYAASASATIADSDAGYSGSRSSAKASARGTWCGYCYY